MENSNLSSDQINELGVILKKRFEKNRHRHAELSWDVIWNRVVDNPDKIYALYQMEQTGGEPDVIGYDSKRQEYLFCDCAPESPKGRRSICYDQRALDSRKAHKPQDSAVHMAAAMGISLLTEEEYRQLQQLGTFDSKTSSWLATPEEIRILGGAIFGDWRFGRVFVYHNGAESYYAARGFRGLLRV
ncbi:MULTISPECIES: DUF4256 domain-containing protein [Sphingobacterium]|uniref:DUF4256 domain-containing protein n=1 Tax=Sphingobacterium TaxID=28453 RepID=UPI0013DBC1F8|nr:MULTISPECIES: DUF4256 domain-containing protein [unclassified Sphingobacterium]